MDFELGGAHLERIPRRRHADIGDASGIAHVIQFTGRFDPSNVAQNICGVDDRGACRHEGRLEQLRVAPVRPVAEHFQPHRAGKPARACQFCHNKLDHADRIVAWDAQGPTRPR